MGGLETLRGWIPAQALVWFAVAFVAFLFLGGRGPRLMVFTQLALPAGELRDRIMELARKAAVRVRQIQVLPPDRWRLLDLWALPVNDVHLTPALLPSLSKREVDALVAHELAYLWRRRGRKVWHWFFFLAWGSVVGGSFAWLLTRGMIEPMRWGPV
jgi:Zn-dependent protease with chaperone function